MPSVLGYRHFGHRRRGEFRHDLPNGVIHERHRRLVINLQTSGESLQAHHQLSGLEGGDDAVVHRLPGRQLTPLHQRAGDVGHQVVSRDGQSGAHQCSLAAPYRFAERFVGQHHCFHVGRGDRLAHRIGHQSRIEPHAEVRMDTAPGVGHGRIGEPRSRALGGAYCHGGEWRDVDGQRPPLEGGGQQREIERAAGHQIGTTGGGHQHGQRYIGCQGDLVVGKSITVDLLDHGAAGIGDADVRADHGAVANATADLQFGDVLFGAAGAGRREQRQRNDEGTATNAGR